MKSVVRVVVVVFALCGWRIAGVWAQPGPQDKDLDSNFFILVEPPSDALDRNDPNYLSKTSHPEMNLPNGLALSLSGKTPLIISGGDSGGPRTAHMRGHSSKHIGVTFEGFDMGEVSGATRSLHWNTLPSSLVDQVQLTAAGSTALSRSESLGQTLHLSLPRNLQTHGIKWSGYFGRPINSDQYSELSILNFSYGSRWKALDFFWSGELNRQEGGQIPSNYESDENDNQLLASKVVKISYRLGLLQKLSLVKSSISLEEDLDDFKRDDPNYTLATTKQLTLLSWERLSDDFVNRWVGSYGILEERRESNNLPDSLDITEQKDLYKGQRASVKLRYTKDFETDKERYLALEYTTEEASGDSRGNLSNANYDGWLEQWILESGGSIVFGMYVLGGSFEYKNFYRNSDSLEFFCPTLFLQSTRGSFRHKLMGAAQTQAPSLSELYDPRYGNSSLMHEKSKNLTYELYYSGYKNSFYKWGLFNTEFENLVQADGSFVPQNIGKARVWGSDILLKQEFELNTIETYFMYLEADDQKNGQRLLYRPRYSLSTKYTRSLASQWQTYIHWQGQYDYNAYEGFSVRSQEKFEEVSLGFKKLDAKRNVEIGLEFFNLLGQSKTWVPGYQRRGRGLGIFLVSHGI